VHRNREVRGQVATFAVVAGFIVSLYVVVAPLSLVLPALKSADPIVYPVVVAALPAAIGYAVVRHRLFGINIVLTRLLVAAAATFVLAIIYIAAVLGVAAAFGVPRGSLPAMLVPAALVAFVLVPAYRGLQGLIARAVYGSRGDPLSVLRTLGERLAQTTPDEVPDRIVRVLRESLKLSWVALDVEQDGTFTRAAEVGAAPDGSSVERFDLSYAGAVPGRLLVQPRPGEQTLGQLDRRLIRHVTD
jgi:two-component system, NarL family, sensor kinase